MMSFRIAVVSALYLTASPLLAADSVALKPATANNVEGPATGALDEKISLSVDPRSSNAPSLSNLAALSVAFCTENSSISNTLINRMLLKQPIVGCKTPERPLHLTGRAQNIGITMVPELAGEWRWRTDYSLEFKPKKPWPTAQNYQLTFDKTVFPDSVTLKNGNYSFVTEPLIPQITNMAFFQDPSDVEKRGVSATVSFNAPVASDVLKKHLELLTEEVTDAPNPAERKIIAKPEKLQFDIKMNENDTEAVITVPLHTLPDKERFLKLVIKPGIIAKFGGQPLKLLPNGQGRF